MHALGVISHIWSPFFRSIRIFITWQSKIEIISPCLPWSSMWPVSEFWKTLETYSWPCPLVSFSSPHLPVPLLPSWATRRGLHGAQSWKQMGFQRNHRGSAHLIPLESYTRVRRRRNRVWDWLEQKYKTLSEKQTKGKSTGGVDQGVERLLNKHEALWSTPSITKNLKNRKKKWRLEENPSNLFSNFKIISILKK